MIAHHLFKNRLTDAKKANELAQKVLSKHGYTHIHYHSKSIINGSNSVTLNFVVKKHNSDDFEIVPITISLQEYMQISNERKEMRK